MTALLFFFANLHGKNQFSSIAFLLTALRKRKGNSRLSNTTYDILSMVCGELAGWIDNLEPEAAIACAGPPGLMASIGESPGRLYLHWGDPPEARKAFALALGKGPKSPFNQNFNELNNNAI